MNISVNKQKIKLIINDVIMRAREGESDSGRESKFGTIHLYDIVSCLPKLAINFNILRTL